MGGIEFLFLILNYKVSVIWTYSYNSSRCSTIITGLVTSGLTEYLLFEDTRRCEWLQRHWTEWRLIAALCWNISVQRISVCLLAEPRGKLRGLEIFLSQGTRPVSWNPSAIITPVAAVLYAFQNSSPNW